MGVPSFFRWLSRTYPQVVLDADPENKTDYLYIDFNAIIHTASSPSDGPNQHTISGIMGNISKNLDKIVKTCKPQKMLYISTDGVAPCTKIMHQRSRRYRSVYDKEEANRKSQTSEVKSNNVLAKNTDTTPSMGNLDALEVNDGTFALVDKQTTNSFDPNSITPGTRFMYEIEQKVQVFIEDRLKNHTSYKKLAVIYSTSRKPGEGEQKIMDFIRKTKNRNLKHTIYSPDADLIFLGASLHGRSIKIMREDLSFVYEQRTNSCHKCGKTGHLPNYCNNLVFNKFIYVDIQILRSILEEQIEFHLSDATCNMQPQGHTSKDRSVNGFFNTNDFRNTRNSRYFDRNSSLERYNSDKRDPHQKGGLKNIFGSSGASKPSVVHAFPNFSMKNMIDDWIFMSFLVGNDFLPTLQCFDIRFQAIEILFDFMIENFKKTKKYITYNGRLQLGPLLNLFRIISRQEDSLYLHKSRKLANARRNFGTNETYETINLSTARGRSHFYSKKLNITKKSEINQLCKDYIIGLLWIYDYYIKGINNWDWYYPYHYAPFLVDLANMENERKYLSNAISHFKDSRSSPLGCLEQQIFVLPPQSRHIAPKIMRDLFDSFPTKIEIDMFDKLLPWQGVVIVPMIDIKKLFSQIRQKKKYLTHEEWSFFIESDDLLFVTRNSVLFKEKNTKELQKRKPKKGDTNDSHSETKATPVESHESHLFDRIKGMYNQNNHIIKHMSDFEMILRPYHKYCMESDQLVICHIVV